MNKSELPFLSAGDLSRLVQSKQISPVKTTGAYLDRTEPEDFRFHSYLTVMREQAMADARRRKPTSPPVSTKDRCTACRWR